MSNYNPEPPNDAEPLGDEVDWGDSIFIQFRGHRRKTDGIYDHLTNTFEKWGFAWRKSYQDSLTLQIAPNRTPIQVKDAEIEEIQSTLNSMARDLGNQRILREKAESERDALADQLAAVVDACIIEVEDSNNTSADCLLCGRHIADHSDQCPLSNLPATVQARRDQFEKMKAELQSLKEAGAKEAIQQDKKLESLEAENERLRKLIPKCPCTDERMCDLHMEIWNIGKALKAMCSPQGGPR